MKFSITILFLLFYGSPFAQDSWKNIYSQHAWAARDKWQKAGELIRLLNITSGSEVADVGCHEGYMAFKLAQKVERSGMVYAVDVESGKLEKVKKRAQENNLTQIKIVKGDHDNPKLPSNTLDGVIILDTYHEMDDHEQILQHIKTSLRNGGRLLICEPIADSRRKLARSEQEKKHELSMEYALSDLKNAGFKIFYQKDNFIDRTKEKGDKMWVVVAVKE
ncbi:MAG: methyltransferase domain-containing protein [Cyclobacteriaceae bacterium]